LVVLNLRLGQQLDFRPHPSLGCSTPYPRFRCSPNPGGMAALLKLFELNKEIIRPEVYLKAGGEALAILFAFCWALTYFYNPAIINKNPLKDRLGYNNLCVGFDTFPAKYVAQILWGGTVYLVIRYSWTDMQRTKLKKWSITKTQYWFSMVASSMFLVSGVCFGAVFMIDPFVSVWCHSLFFIQYMVVRMICVWANMYEQNGTSTSSWIFMVVYGFATILFSGCVIFNFIMYDRHISDPDFKAPYLHWGVTATFDYTWFVCLALTTKFLPDDSDIVVSYQLVPRGKQGDPTLIGAAQDDA